MVGCIYRHFKGISIHASAKEATTVSSFSGVTEYFNPRLREGGDGIQRHNRLEESKISIHASAKEATCRRIICIFIILFYFNPRLREGGDQSVRLLRLLALNFNPRLREGGDVVAYV